MIYIKNLLPDHVLEEMKVLVRSLEAEFRTPSWSSGPKARELPEWKKKAFCEGKDIWFPVLRTDTQNVVRPWVPSLLYDILENYFIQQGIMQFCQHTKDSVFRLIPQQELDGKMHIVTYGDGGYYNWHRDRAMPEGPYLYGNSPARRVLFTFNLCLCWGEIMQGGDLLFMHNNKTVERPFRHNSMTIFPAHVQHAATRVSLPESDNFLDRRISFQFWMAGTQIQSNGLARWK